MRYSKRKRFSMAKPCVLWPDKIKTMLERNVTTEAQSESRPCVRLVNVSFVAARVNFVFAFPNALPSLFSLHQRFTMSCVDFCLLRYLFTNRFSNLPSIQGNSYGLSGRYFDVSTEDGSKWILSSFGCPGTSKMEYSR